MFSKKSYILVSFLVSAAVLFGFQNCGTNSSGSSSLESNLNSKIVFSEDFESAPDVAIVPALNNSTSPYTKISAHSGNFGMRLNNTPSYLTRDSLLIVGKKYKFSYWGRRVSFGANDPIPYFEIYSQNGGYGNSEVTNSVWTFNKFEFIANGTSFNFDFYIHHPGTNVVDLDDIQLVQID